jgi:hypothetical protein
MINRIIKDNLWLKYNLLNNQERLDQIQNHV